MTELIVILLCTFAYRLRGSGKVGTPVGRVAWALTVAFCVSILGDDMRGVVCAAVGGFTGMLFSHSKVYRIDSVQDASAMYAIHLARMVLISGSPLVLASAALATGAHALSRRLEDRRKVRDMLRVAEPLVGLSYGLLFVGISKFGGF